MKKLNKVICAVLVLAMLCSSLLFTVSAEDAANTEHKFEPTIVHGEGSISSVNALFAGVNASDVEGNLFNGSSFGNGQDILSVAGSETKDNAYVTFYANKTGSIDKKNPFYQINAECPNISVEAGSTAYYVIDFDVATHGNLFAYMDVSVMLRRVSDGGGFPFSANVSFADYINGSGVWSHVTVIGDIATNEVYLYVNGEYVTTSGYAYNKDQLSGNTSLSPKGVRIDFALSDGTYDFEQGDNVAFDNFSQRVYTEAELTDGLPTAIACGDLTGWSGYNDGNAGDLLPAIVKVDGTEYNSMADAARVLNSNDTLKVEFLSCPLTPVSLCTNAIINTNGMKFDSLVKVVSPCEIVSTDGNIVTTAAPFTENISISSIATNKVIPMVKAPNADNLLGAATFSEYNKANMRATYVVTDSVTGSKYIRDTVYSENVDGSANVYIDWKTSNDSSYCKYELGVNQYIVFDIDFAIDHELDDARKINLNPITRNSSNGGVWGNTAAFIDDVYELAGIGFGEFAHITAVLSPDTRALAIFVNGEYVTTVENAIASVESGYYLSGFRMFSNSNATANYNNISIRSLKSAELTAAINGNDISAWSGNLYVEGYQLPQYPAIATVDGENVHSAKELESKLTGNKATPAVVKILHVFDEPITVNCDAVIYTYNQAVQFVDSYGNVFVPVNGVIEYDAPYQANREESILTIPGQSSNSTILKAIKGNAKGNLLNNVTHNSVTKNGYLWGTAGYRTASLVTNLETGDVFYRESAILDENGGMNKDSNEYVTFNFESVSLTYEEGKNEYIVADFDFGTDGDINDEIGLQLIPRSTSGGSWATSVHLGELHVNRGEMAHITLVFDLTDNYAHVFINGKLAYSVKGGAMDSGKWTDEYLTGTEFTVSEFKLCSDQKTSTVCLDNLNIRAFESSSEDDAILGAVESGRITNWADSVYNADYVCATIPTLAVIDGVEYGSLVDVDKILANDDGSVKNVEFKHAPASVVKVMSEAIIETNTLNVKFDWNTGIYAFEMDDEWYASTETGLAYASSKLTHNVEGTVHIFETINKDNCWTNATAVTWYLDAALTTYDVVFYVYGDQIAPLSDRTYVKGGKLYNDQWKAIELTDDGYTVGEAVESYPVASPVIGEKSYVYAPIVEAIDFAATDINVGAVVNTNIALTVYVAKSQTVSEGEIVVIDGVEYVAITFDIAPADVDKIVEAQFLVADAEGNVYTQVYDICFVDYASEILKGNYNDVYKKVVANLLAYANEAHVLFEGTGIAAVEELLETYASYVYDVELGEKIDTSDLASVIRSAALNLNSAPEFVFKVARGFRGTITFTYTSLGEEKTVSKTVDARVAEQLVVFSGLNVYDFCGDVTITVTEEGAGESIVGAYNLASYAQSVENNGFAKALLAYAKAAEEYMLTK